MNATTDCRKNETNYIPPVYKLPGEHPDFPIVKYLSLFVLVELNKYKLFNQISGPGTR